MTNKSSSLTYLASMQFRHSAGDLHKLLLMPFFTQMNLALPIGRLIEQSHGEDAGMNPRTIPIQSTIRTRVASRLEARLRASSSSLLLSDSSKTSIAPSDMHISLRCQPTIASSNKYYSGYCGRLWRNSEPDQARQPHDSHLCHAVTRIPPYSA